MATAQGSQGKMAFREEAVYAVAPVIDGTKGLRLFIDNFADESDKQPVDTDEIAGLSIDRREFIEDAIIVGATLNYSMRYSGIHAVLTGFAMGDLLTTGTISPFTHAATLADGLKSLTLILQSPKRVGGTTVYVDENFIGMKVARSTWSHRVGQPLKQKLEFVGSHLDHDTTPITLPAQPGGVPTEPFIMWSHLDSPIFIDTDTAAPVNLKVVGYEIVLDNGLERRFKIQAGRKSAEPARDDFRTLMVTIEVDQDAGWEEFVRAYGYLSANSTQDFNVQASYADPGAITTNSLQLIVANCRTIRVPRGVPGASLLTQKIEFRAHFQTGGTPINQPFSITMSNGTQGPTYLPTYGDVVLGEAEPPPPKPEEAFIFRHMTSFQDLVAIREGTWNPGEYEAFNTHFIAGEAATRDNLIAQGKKHFGYYEVMSFPPASYSDPWYDWWRAEFQVTRNRGLRSSAGRAGIFKLNGECLHRQFVDWALITAAERQIIADKMFELLPATSGLFLDQAWLFSSPDFFFCDPVTARGCPAPCDGNDGGPLGIGAFYDDFLDFPGQNPSQASKWIAWQSSILAFYQLVDSMAAARGTWALKNGSHYISRGQIVPRPIYYENSTNNGENHPNTLTEAIRGWREHEKNVLSIDQPDLPARTTVFQAWKETGGWIACTGSGVQSANADVNAFYAAAAAERASW